MLRSRVAVQLSMLALGCALSFAVSRASDAPTSTRSPLTLSLSDAIGLALRANFDLQSAALERISQRFAVYVAVDKFKPHVNLLASAGKVWSHGPLNVQDPASLQLSMTPHGELLLPTGALVSLDWQYDLNKPPLYDRPLSASFVLTLSQPLIRDLGIDINHASVDIAVMRNRIDQLNYQNSVITILYAVILAFRDVTQASVLQDIAQKAVARSRDLLDINYQMVAAGRIARSDLIQIESEIATREVNAINAESDTINYQAALLRLLALSEDSPVVLQRERVVEAPSINKDDARAQALSNRPEYLAQLLVRQLASKNLWVAENNRLWDLRLTAQHRRGGVTDPFGASLTAPISGASHSSFLGLTLNVPLVPVILDQQVIDSRVAVQQADVAIAQVKNGVMIEADAARRTLDLRYHHYELAKRARELAEKKLANEREKLAAGRSSNFQVVRFVDDLVNAEAVEIRTSITYLNAVTALQIKTGTLLKHWDVLLQN